MTGTLNKALLIGHLGQDPDIRTMNSGELSAQLVEQARGNGQEDIALVLEQALQKRPAWKN